MMYMVWSPHYRSGAAERADQGGYWRLLSSLIRDRHGHLAHFGSGGLRLYLADDRFVPALAHVQIGAHAPASSQSVLHGFCLQSACSDGAIPFSPLTMDANGNLFGSTAAGGATNAGVVFELAR